MDWTLTTQIVGSYHKPTWLVERTGAGSGAGRFWTTDDPVARAEWQDDATRLAILDQAAAGMTVVTDGEQRRQSFTGYFYRLGGIDAGTLVPRDAVRLEYIESRASATGGPFTQKFPVVTGPVQWQAAMALEDLRFLKREHHGGTKMTVAGPVTLAARLVDRHYGDPAALAFAVADALNRELRVLDDEGVDLLQLDDPHVHFGFPAVREFAAEAIDRALHGIRTRTAVHVCYGYATYVAGKRVDPAYGDCLELLSHTRVDDVSLEYAQPGHEPDLLARLGDKGVILGVLDLGTDAPEPVETVVARARGALQVVPAERLRLAPDCGMWFLSRPDARARLHSLAAAAEQLRTA